MAFEEGTASSQEDFASKVNTFAAANGWTTDEFNAASDRMSIHNGGIYMHWSWDNVNDIGVHQSLGWVAPGAPSSHTNDSGNGGENDSSRSLPGIGNGPFTKYTLFQGSLPTEHLYGVLEFAPGQFRHFGAFDIEKFGDWTGGECVCTSVWNNSVRSNQTSANHNMMVDAACNTAAIASTLHLEGFPDQPASGKWGVGAQSITPGNDGDSNGRVNIIGGMRGGPYTTAMGGMPTSLTQGFIPLIRVPLFYNITSPNPDQARTLGYMPNCRVINMNAFQPGDTFPQGGDTWVVFPMIRRQAVSGTDEQSGLGGIAYKKT